MKHYLIHYHDANDVSLYFRCDADDAEHAHEQLVDHERTVSGGVIFWEILKVSI